MPLRKTPSSSKTEKASVENYDIELNDFETLNKSLSEVLELVDSLSPKNTFEKTIKNVVGMLGKHIQILANNCNEMSNSVDNVEVDLAKTDQYLRRNTLVVTGLEYKKETETYDTLSSTVADKLTTSGIKVNSNDFSACHRNGKNVKTATVKGKQVKIPPTVTVRFYNANKKDQVLNKYKNDVNGKPNPVRVVQSLNHHYQTLKTNISNLCREKDVKIAWIHWRSASSGLCIKFDNQIILSKIHSMADFNKQFNNMNS